MWVAITGSRGAAAVGALLLVVVAVLTMLSGQPPDPLPASAPTQEFSAERALGSLREFATEPRLSRPGPARIAAYDLTQGLSGVPGFVPRPAGIERSPRGSSDAIVVTRTYEF